MSARTRVTEILGIEKPVIQAAMGWISRSQLSSAVSNAGGMGMIETSSGELETIHAEIAKMVQPIKRILDEMMRTYHDTVATLNSRTILGRGAVVR